MTDIPTHVGLIISPSTYKYVVILIFLKKKQWKIAKVCFVFFIRGRAVVGVSISKNGAN